MYALLCIEYSAILDAWLGVRGVIGGQQPAGAGKQSCIP
jgi:hypothetical protein